MEFLKENLLWKLLYSAGQFLSSSILYYYYFLAILFIKLRASRMIHCSMVWSTVYSTLFVHVLISLFLFYFSSRSIHFFPCIFYDCFSWKQIEKNIRIEHYQSNCFYFTLIRSKNAIKVLEKNIDDFLKKIALCCSTPVWTAVFGNFQR